ncbi:LmeA family phospholipid-binding protein [Nostoc sp.]|uniref:LmeA family phospholipid-binding protein n=1 Tax=Nostoc sp. TaxID=1180 RepID=UPI002FF4FDB1
MPDEQRLEEGFISQEAEKRISEKLDGAEKIEIDVQTDLLKIVQGQADGVSFAGKGLMIQEDIRIQEIKLQTDSININPLSALFGQIELSEAVNATARIILTYRSRYEPHLGIRLCSQPDAKLRFGCRWRDCEF